MVPKNPKFSQMHQKCFPNVSQIQPSLPISQSFKYCKYQIKHTQFIIIIYIYSKFIPITDTWIYAEINELLMENGPKVSVRNMDFDIQSKIMKRNPFLYGKSYIIWIVRVKYYIYKYLLLH